MCWTTENAPCAFAFDELKVASAHEAKKLLLAQERGGEDALTADDHYDLGLYLLSRDRPALATAEFKAALKIDDSLRDDINAARQEYRERRKQRLPGPATIPVDGSPSPEGQPAPPSLADVVKSADQADRQQIIEQYKRFGESVRREINKDLVLIETDHFLIWTDWRRPHHYALAQWCEQMYAAVATTLGLPADNNVFLGKCPVFCFRTKAGFLRFGRTYDNWTISSSAGYSRTERNGYVHVVVYLRGTSPLALDRLAATLVHEGTHAVVHRCGRTGNISGWIGEGLAEYMPEEVLGDRCLYGEIAQMVARQYVQRDLPIGQLLRTTGMPQAHEYPVAHSLVRFLIEQDRAAFAAVLQDLKSGDTVEKALHRRYNGMTFETLEAAWRERIRNSS